MLGLGGGELALLGFILSFLVFGVLGTAFWIWMLADCAMNEKDANEKLAWIIIIVFTHFIGAAIYFFVRRPRRKREVGR